MKKILLILIVSIYLINFIYAETGCCFDPNTGSCNYYSDSGSCTNLGGQFSSSSTCSNLAKCQKGCCSLGTNNQYVTARTCEIQSAAYGFNYPENFQNIDQASCEASSGSDAKGACLLGGDYRNRCIYTTLNKCPSGNFYPNTFCIEPSLNTTCNITTKTFCYDEDVYYKDTCDNPAGKKTDCNYDTGTICKAKSVTEAYCKSLNCEGGKKNGESWCVDITGEGAVITGEVNPFFATSDIFLPFVSARNTLYCDGQSEEDKYCETQNGNELCCDLSWDICGEDMCHRCISEVFKYGGGNERVKGCVFGERCGAEEEAVSVGSRYYKQYCLNGQIITEPCADFRMETCMEGECQINLADECLGANLGSEEKSNKNKIDENTCDAEYCTIFSPSGEGEKANKLVEELGLDLCLPKIASGQEFWTATNEGSICSTGNYEAEVYFDNDKGCHSGGGFNGPWILAKEGGENMNWDDKWGFAAIIDSNMDHWKQWSCEHKTLTTTCENRIGNIFDSSFGNNEAIKLAEHIEKAGPDPAVIGMLKKRCQALGDCVGKTNWIGEKGTGEVNYDFDCSPDGRDDHVKCTLSFECIPWKAPAGSESCELCGQDGLPCSEYRCKSLGKGCEYKEPDGADKGYCISSSDHTAPIIGLESINPSSPVPPYTPVEIKIKTSEEAECKFSVNSAGASYSDMNYDFGNSYSLEHSLVLNLPGQTSNLDEDISKYPLITKDGKYKLYVRCIDAKGNGEIMNPFLIEFEVMKYPDTSSPILSNFEPLSGSLIKFNTTEKQIRFKINEPAECNWDYNDKPYEYMSNNFTCDMSITDSTILNGYHCQGLIKNITTNLSLQSRYFIRCKDQPWIENNSKIVNGVNYSRNANDQSTNYILIPSSELRVYGLIPQGSIKLNPQNQSFQLQAFTSGGSNSGRAQCKYRISNSTIFEGLYNFFSSTNSTNHKKMIEGNLLGEGTYYIEVMCQDNSENIARNFTTITLAIDKANPIITRVYQISNTLKLITDEFAACYFSFDKSLNCSFNTNNASTFQGFEKEHTTEWIYDKKYYIKCKDYYGNENILCNAIVKTY